MIPAFGDPDTQIAQLGKRAHIHNIELFRLRPVVHVVRWMGGMRPVHQSSSTEGQQFLQIRRCASGRQGINLSPWQSWCHRSIFRICEFQAMQSRKIVVERVRVVLPEVNHVGYDGLQSLEIRFSGMALEPNPADIQSSPLNSVRKQDGPSNLIIERPTESNTGPCNDAAQRGYVRAEIS